MGSPGAYLGLSHCPALFAMPLFVATMSLFAVTIAPGPPAPKPDTHAKR